MDKPTTAILSRTNKGLRPFEAALSEARIPYFLVGRSGFFAQPEIKAAVNFMQCCLYPADYSLAGALRTSFWPVKYLPKTKLLSRMKELQTDKEPSYWHLLAQEPTSLVENKNLKSLSDFVTFIHGLSRYKALPAGDALKQVLGTLRAGDYYAEEEQTPDSDPLENLAELLKIAKRYSTIKEFLDYCRRATAASKKKSGVALATVHAVKGLEFNTVFFTGVSDGVLPHAKATDLEEERAIFFVGASRAKRRLVLTYSGQPSGFVVPYLQVNKEEA
jgi:DNA helicase-2/ATP-dependent DNA helicase PcrA